MTPPYQPDKFLPQSKTLELISYWQELGITELERKSSTENINGFTLQQKAMFYHDCMQFDAAGEFYKKLLHKLQSDGKKNAPAHFFVRAGIKGYNACTDQKTNLAYFPIPKIACTSIKHLFYFITNHKIYDETTTDKHIHQYYKAGMYEFDMSPYDSYHKFTVLRDPIKRLLSGYRNRVLFYDNLRPLLRVKDPDFEQKLCVGFANTQLPPPDLDAFALNLPFFAEAEKSIAHHCNPINSYLTDDLAKFDKIYRIEDLSELVKFLSAHTGRALQLDRHQDGGPKIGLKDLSEEAFYKLLEFYKDDYIKFSDFYSRDQIITEYELANDK